MSEPKPCSFCDNQRMLNRELRAENARLKSVEFENKAVILDKAGANVAKLLGMLEKVEAENARLDKLINAPEILDFIKAIQLESVHQRERWGRQHDEQKMDADWFWLIGYLAGKALFNPGDDKKKQLHRIITIGAAACNWHAAKKEELGE